MVCYENALEYLLKIFKLDKLVKGGDYSKEQVVRYEIVEGYGGELRSLNFFDDYLSAAIVQRIQGG